MPSAYSGGGGGLAWGQERYPQTRPNAWQTVSGGGFIGHSGYVPLFAAGRQRLFPWDGSLRSALFPRKESLASCLQWWICEVRFSRDKSVLRCCFRNRFLRCLDAVNARWSFQSNRCKLPPPNATGINRQQVRPLQQTQRCPVTENDADGIGRSIR